MKWKRAALLLAGVGALVLCGLLVFLGSRPDLEALVGLEIERIRAAGEPLTYEEAAPPAVPDEENAAVVFYRAFEAVKGLEGRIAKILSQNQKEQVFGSFEHEAILSIPADKLRSVLAAYREPMALTEEALRRPRCRFDVNFAAEFPILLHHRSALRTLGRLFAVRAFLSHAEGRHAETMACIRTFVAINDAITSDGMSDMEFDHFYDLARFIDLVRNLEAAAPLPDSTRLEVIGILTQFDCRRRFRESLVGERIKYLDMFDMLAEEGLTHPGNPDSAAYSANSERRGKRLLLRNMLEWLRATADAIDASSRPPWESIPAVVEACSRLRELFESFIPPIDGCVSWSFDFSALSIQRAWAERNLAVVALSCELYSSKHGEYPPALDRLVPEFLPQLPPDPFTGEPLVYRRTAGGFILHSVGDNLTDDGGRDWKATPGGDDVFWTVKRPAAPPTE